MNITPITGTVIHGKKLGRTLGYPTANISYTGDLEDGVYKMNIIIDNKIYPGMGTYFKEKHLLEAHLFDVELDLYGKEITIYPLHKTRDNTSFENVDELTKAIQQDEQSIRKNNWTVLTFGTFEYLHPGHLSYLMQAKVYGDILVTIVALDQTVEKIKGNTPDKSQEERKANLNGLNISNHVVQLGNQKNVYQCLDDWKPKVICLGYDQHSFDAGIQQYCTKQKLTIPEIIRLQPFKSDIYKSSIIKDTL